MLDYTLLNGYTGIGLVLLSQQKLRPSYTWDSVLLMDIQDSPIKIKNVLVHVKNSDLNFEF